MKKFMLICAPVSSRSGYGDHARDLVYSFYLSGKYNIKIIDVNWGSTPRNALSAESEKINIIKSMVLLNPQKEITSQPDIYVDIRIPNEFQRPGKFNIGITAGIESNAVSTKWLECCNNMDLIIVPSEHSKFGFVNSVYDKFQNAPDGKQQKVGELKLEKPMEVLFEGVGEEIYKPLNIDEIDTDFFDMLNEKVPEKFAFLSVGLWGQGGYGEDRKDLGRTIKIFYETFANKKKQPALIMKTSGATFSIMDREDILKKMNDIKSRFPKGMNLPNVYLLHGDLSDVEMNYLYNHPKIKAMVSLTHGEGFGRPLLEASMVGLPVIASNWSGHVDFLQEDKSMLLPGSMVPVPKSVIWEDILIKESNWFQVNETNCYKALSYLFENEYEIKNKAKALMNINREKFTLNKMADKLEQIIQKYIQDKPKQVSIKLPKLKKIKNKSTEPSIKSKFKLPKLKNLTESV